MMYSIGLSSIENVAGEKVYTYNVYKRIFFGILWIPVFTFSDFNKQYAYEMCERYVKDNNGNLIDYDD